MNRFLTPPYVAVASIVVAFVLMVPQSIKVSTFMQSSGGPTECGTEIANEIIGETSTYTLFSPNPCPPSKDALELSRKAMEWDACKHKIQETDRSLLEATARISYANAKTDAEKLDKYIYLLTQCAALK